uniref:Receptor-like serine/threonine-protein kinase n=1 Tax=Fagus sylvatica TaxID=28930 RepID=A0A2N9G9R4_FAGSY
MLLLFLLPQFVISQDTITISKPIRDNGSVLVSNEETFALGFFSPGKSTYRYVGIWYYKAPDNPVVWVANRDRPINDRSGVLSIDVLGNLVLHVKDRNTPIWSTTTNIVSKSRNNETHAQLWDSGNLVLFHNETSKVLWQSFDYPTDTMLPYMKLGLDRTTGLNRILTSWKSKDDPGTGNCSYKLVTNGSSPELFSYRGNARWWRSGHWNGQGWSGVPALASPNLLYNFSMVNNQTEITTSWIVLQPSLFSRLVVNESGSIERFIARERDSQKWVSVGSVPSNLCDNYGKCGAYGKCELQNGTEFECTCLPGFRPNSQNEWTARNASGGCVRKRGEASVCKRGEGFAKVENVKLPDSSVARLDSNMSLMECEQQCLDNCNCTAYGSVKEEAGCMRWYGSLMDTRVLTGGQNLYVRVDALELGALILAQLGPKLKQTTVWIEDYPVELQGNGKGFFANKRRLAIMVVVLLVTSILLIFLFAHWLIKRKKNGRRKQPTFFNDVTVSSTTFQDSRKLDESRRKPDLPVFEISTILAATDNFSPDKKLGQGGFGPVYKGQLDNGQEIAVKTLSRSSKQGTQEFMNEVMLIAKLQHRNLVRLFGCCIHKEEKIGYMSPEYAMEGLYSIKSDVFAFGVLTLEIISGKRNNHYHVGSPCLNLIGHVWDLWMEGKGLEIVDSLLGEAYPAHEVSRCVHIGLLCVQEQATDRPTMAEIVFMLGQ